MYDSRILSALSNSVVVTINYRLGIFGYLVTSNLVAEDPTVNWGIQGHQHSINTNIALLPSVTATSPLSKQQSHRSEIGSELGSRQHFQFWRGSRQCVDIWRGSFDIPFFLDSSLWRGASDVLILTTVTTTKKQSAGGASVVFHLIIQNSWGLYNRALTESPGPWWYRSVAPTVESNERAIVG